MRTILGTMLGAGLLALASSPANAQWGGGQSWDTQYQDRSNGTDRTLCDVERVTRVIGNVASALRDRGYGGNYSGSYDCQNYRQLQDSRYQQQYQHPELRHVPPYRSSSQPQTFTPFYQNGGGSYPHQPDYRPGLPSVLPQGNRVCVLTPGGFQICP